MQCGEYRSLSAESKEPATAYKTPPNSNVLFDEVGYYCVNGMAIMAAQGRSLGFSLVFATQDIPAMLRENDKEAKSIIANTTTKLFMRVEELEQTAKLAINSSGKGMKAQVGGFSGKSGDTHMRYLDDMSARLEVVDRISSLDLRALGVGEAYVTWHDQYFKVKTFHAFPEGQYGKDLPKLELRVNHFVAVSRPSPSDVKKEETLPLIAEKLADPRFAQIVETRAKEERGVIEKAAADKRDPAKMKNEIACGAVAFLRANRKTGQNGDYLTASCDPTAFTDSFGRPDGRRRDRRRVRGRVPTDPDRIAAQRSDQPSTMRRVEHGVTVDGRDTFKMAEKLQTNDATLRFLEALNFDADQGAEPGVEVVDTAIEKAVIFDDEPETSTPPPTPFADSVEIERADVASAKATQWTGRAAKPILIKSRDPVPDLETAVKSGNVEDMTASFLADLLNDDE